MARTVSNYIAFIKKTGGSYQLGQAPCLNPLLAEFPKFDKFRQKQGAVDGALRRACAKNFTNCVIIDYDTFEVISAARINHRSVVERIIGY